MNDALLCEVCGHKYIFISADRNLLAKYIWDCEVLAEVEKCVAAVLSRQMIAEKLTWKDFEKEVYK